METTGLFVFCIVFMITEIAVLPSLLLGGSSSLDALYSSVIQPLPEGPTWTASGNPIIDVLTGIVYFLEGVFYILELVSWIVIQMGKLIFFVMGLAEQFANICIQYPMLMVINIPVFVFVIYALLKSLQIVGAGGSGGS
jgi:hypothetical protein